MRKRPILEGSRHSIVGGPVVLAAVSVLAVSGCAAPTAATVTVVASPATVTASPITIAGSTVTATVAGPTVTTTIAAPPPSEPPTPTGRGGPDPASTVQPSTSDPILAGIPANVAPSCTSGTPLLHSDEAAECHVGVPENDIFGISLVRPT